MAGEQIGARGKQLRVTEASARLDGSHCLAVLRKGDLPLRINEWLVPMRVCK